MAPTAQLLPINVIQHRIRLFKRPVRCGFAGYFKPGLLPNSRYGASFLREIEYAGEYADRVASSLVYHFAIPYRISLPSSPSYRAPQSVSLSGHSVR